MSADKKPVRAWKSGSATYEGLPLMLRTPVGLDYDSLRKGFPKLLIVRQVLAEVLSNGLPDPDYNEGLANLDHHLINMFDRMDQGIPVLVETFNGKRTYYSYVAEIADIKTQESSTASQFPTHSLSWDVREDPDWNFIKGYAQEYGF